MKVSEFIKQLQELQSVHGDLEVMSYSFSGIRNVPAPRIRYLLILKGKETKIRYWTYEEKERMGQMVIDV